MKIRAADKWGAGYFGAPRGARKHRGVDLIVSAGAEIRAMCAGEVTRLGQVYADTSEFRYVEITTSEGDRFRHMYVFPSVPVGAMVEPGTPIGVAQDLSKRYPGITNHTHFEIITKSGAYKNPTEIAEAFQ